MSPIHGAERLTAIFGASPTFHGAEVVRLVRDRAAAAGRDHAGPTLTLSVRVFTFGPDVAPNGGCVLHDGTPAMLGFGGVAELELEGSNEQNALA
jgi:hypothetical protein